MHLTPEERAIGKKNFNTAVGSTRRDFLKQSLLAGTVAGGGMGAMYFGYESRLSDPVRVGIIGTGDEGNVLIGALNPDFIDVRAIADIRPFNIWRAFHGDWSSDNAIKVRPGLMTMYGWETEEQARDHVKVFTDGYQPLIDAKDELQLEGVIIALPLHLHAEAAIAAMRAGLHVLTEKLMAHSVHECKEMARVADETGLYLATGHQRHYNILYDNAVHTIKQGLLGDVHHIRAQWHREKDTWSPPLPEPQGYSLRDFEMQLNEIRAQKDREAEAKLLAEHELYAKMRSWSGRAKDEKLSASERALWKKRVEMTEMQANDHVDAEKYGYETKTLPDGKGTVRPAVEELIRWRLWNRTGGGLMAELGSHQLDASSIFISAQRDDGQKVLPLTVTGVGGRHLYPPDRDIDDHVYCYFEFPRQGYYKDFESMEVADENKKLVVSYSSINGNGFGGYGEVVMGTGGTLILEREEEVMLFPGSGAATEISVKETKSGPVLDTTQSGGAEAAVAEAVLSGPVSRGYREEIEHWAWCIRNRDPANQPKCPPKVALADAVIALTSNIAMTGTERMKFDPAWFDPKSDATPEGIPPRKASEIG
jgi:predicted dehydrogenase